jgi:hypothetical protein
MSPVALTTRARFLSMSPEERLSALRAFLKEREPIEEIPVTSNQASLRLQKWSRHTWIPIMLLLLFGGALFGGLHLRSVPHFSYWYFGYVLTILVLYLLIPHLLAKYYYRPLKAKNVAEWERVTSSGGSPKKKG